MTDLFNYSRRESSVVRVGNTPLGGDNPIRIQSMNNTSTMDTEASVEQAERIVDAGGDYVRLTTQGVREAANMAEISRRLRNDGYTVPLVADVHFNPKAADEAALHCEAVRINPGNYVDPGRTFKKLEYTDEEYAEEIKKIDERLVPFLNICREHHTAVRIGVNHGSLSDRIMSRYGDTPEGMVESCMEFLRVCVREDFTDVVISIKSSNTAVMVRTVRMLVSQMDKEEMSFPIHLGVTEAGEGEDGRVKSALGIGALLADGLGDTVRVSLTEEPEAEIPVAKKIVDYVGQRAGHMWLPAKKSDDFDFLNPQRRTTIPVGDIGGENVPVVISERIEAGYSEIDEECRPDYIYYGQKLPADRDKKIGAIVDANVWSPEDENTYPAYNYQHMLELHHTPASKKFLFLSYPTFNAEVRACLKLHPEVVVIVQSNHENRVGEIRALLHMMMCQGYTNPAVIFQAYGDDSLEDFQLKSAVDMGPFVFDGFCDGVFLASSGKLSHKQIDRTAYGILQAGRLRVTRTEYISCPGCGRTLYDLRSAAARIRKATTHLKGLKIGIMGCIVNGPGEMADADYGYVGAGKDKISLYRGKECVEKNIPQEDAVERLLQLIENDKIK